MKACVLDGAKLKQTPGAATVHSVTWETQKKSTHLCINNVNAHKLISLGLAQYIKAFEKAEIDAKVLPHLTYGDLKELGITWQQERQCILEKIAQLYSDTDVLKTQPRWKRKEKSDSTDNPQSKKYAPNMHSTKKGLKQPTLSEMVQSVTIHAIPRQKKERRGSYGLKPWQSIPGTEFVVDRFKATLAIPHKHWFLTHFHSDHYGGLSKSFAKGTIYCSETTARLVQLHFQLPDQTIQALPYNTEIEIAGAKVTFLDANHCPGAVMIAVETALGERVLHTGDARLTPKMYQYEKLKKWKAEGCVLILDTTFCDPKQRFPSQDTVIQYVTDTVTSELFNPKTLFLFGTYGIGKERLFLAVARSAGKPVYVNREKMKSLECMELAESDRALLTTDHEITNLHAIPLWKVGVVTIEQILKRYGTRFTHAVGFRPTGWNYNQQSQNSKSWHCTQSGKITLHQVPYSEHSSFDEMREFVQWLRPTEIIPSVGNDLGRKREKMISWLKQKTLD